MNTDPGTGPKRDLRNALAAAIHDGPSAVLELQETGMPPHSWEECPHKPTYLGDADALIAAPSVIVATPISTAEGASGPARAIAHEIVAERQRQDAKWGAPHDVRNGTGDGATLLGRTFGELRQMMQAAVDYMAERHESMMAAVLLEEVFEALAEADDDKLRAELIQVAAVAAKWVQIIDARGVRS